MFYSVPLLSTQTVTAPSAAFVFVTRTSAHFPVIYFQRTYLTYDMNFASTT